MAENQYLLLVVIAVVVIILVCFNSNKDSYREDKQNLKKYRGNLYRNIPYHTSVCYKISDLNRSLNNGLPRFLCDTIYSKNNPKCILKDHLQKYYHEEC